MAFLLIMLGVVAIPLIVTPIAKHEHHKHAKGKDAPNDGKQAIAWGKGHHGRRDVLDAEVFGANFTGLSSSHAFALDPNLRGAVSDCFNRGNMSSVGHDSGERPMLVTVSTTNSTTIYDLAKNETEQVSGFVADLMSRAMEALPGAQKLDPAEVEQDIPEGIVPMITRHTKEEMERYLSLMLEAPLVKIENGMVKCPTEH